MSVTLYICTFTSHKVAEGSFEGSFLVQASSTVHFCSSTNSTSNGVEWRHTGHRLRILFLRILKLPKMHIFLRILKLSVLKLMEFKLSHSSPPSSNKLFIANAAFNCWIKNSVMSTVRDLLTRWQFSIISMITSSQLQSLQNRLQLYCLLQYQNWSLQLPLFPFNRKLCSTVDSVVQIWRLFS